MNQKHRFGWFGPRVLASVAVAGAAWAVYIPTPGSKELTELSAKFRFDKRPLSAFAAEFPDAPIFAPGFQPFSKYLEAFLPTGAALTDLDGNGLADEACVTDPYKREVSVHPVPGRKDSFASFVLTLPAGENPQRSIPTGCLASDLNQDGLVDLLVYYWGRSPLMFIQKKGGLPLASDRFEAAELKAGLEVWYTQSMTTTDVDGDGRLDLVVANYFPDGAKVLNDDRVGTEEMNHGFGAADNGAYNRLLLGLDPAAGQGLFREASGAFGDDLGGRQWTIATGAADFDGDNLPEVIFINDHGPDRFLLNRSMPGQPKFELIINHRDALTTKSSTLGRDGFHGMGMEFGDLNRDGHLDWTVSNFGADNLVQQSHFTWINTGKLADLKEGRAPFTNQAEPMGLARTVGVPWDVRVADFDNDGRLEVFRSVGFMRGTITRATELHEMALQNDLIMRYPQVWHHFSKDDDFDGKASNAFFTQQSDGRFTDIGELLGMREAGVCRGAATGDADGDGHIDLLLTGHKMQPVFYHNTSASGAAFLVMDVRLPYAPSNADAISVRNGPTALASLPPSRSAIGALLKVTLPDGTKLASIVDGGTGWGGKRSPVVHVGLGALPAEAKIEVEVSWRDTRGDSHRRTTTMAPGWHTVWLGTTTEIAEQRP